MKGRRWTEQEDQLLRESVLQSISNGGTQLEAFEKVGRKLERTPGACGFRWNAVLRRQDPISYSEAKKKRVYKQIQKKRGLQLESFSQIIASIRQMEKVWNQLRDEVQELSKQLTERNKRYERLLEENKRLKDEKRSYEWYQQEVKGRYLDLLHLLKHLQEESSLDPAEKINDEKESEINADTGSNSSS
ncbi:hypothetical protein ACFO25_09015 [Paenactinomyces guangxiensis]|uniref:Uncharacterized protein n=1 Tax=Paenactinomyces guangxiensis TaxID=1490290 RepID=A0A7W2A7I1_9BACL|nr:hypothetical protein [Paenactinomyces guangxiensis]MBA4492813.1 hypothetical protein [Paenactinomyces guangxiensis]MBH8590338.1 hypothetical protein [Paenactinomyces guangxiensis]